MQVSAKNHTVTWYCIVGTTQVWVWPTTEYPRKPASILPFDNMAVLVKPKTSFQIDPKRFQQVATEF